MKNSPSTLSNIIYRILPLVFLLILMQGGSLAAEKKTRIALFSFAARNTPEETASIASDLLELYLFSSNNFEIYEKRKLKQILDEQKNQNKPVKKIDEAVRLGRNINVEYVVIGSVMKTDRFHVTAKVINVNKGTVCCMESTDFASKNLMNRSIKNLADEIVISMSTLNKKIFYTPDLRFYLKGFFPGWGQAASRHYIKAGIIIGAFTAATAFAGYGIYNYLDKKEKYDSLTIDDDKYEFNKRYSDRHNAWRLQWISIGIWIGVYLYNWIDVIFFSFREKPAGPDVTATVLLPISINITCSHETGMYFSIAWTGRTHF